MGYRLCRFMAWIKFNDGKDAKCSAETGRRIWDILNGNAEPDEREEAVANRVAKIYLNWHNAPDDYIEKHKDSIFRKAVCEWIVGEDTIGGAFGVAEQKRAVFTRPEPNDKENLAFCKKWGLLKGGQATALARQYCNVAHR